MKKNLMMLAAVLCCAMTLPMLVSCTKDDVKTPVEDTKPAAAVMGYTLSVNDQMLSQLTLTVEYYDADGQVKSEQMTQNNWTKSVKTKLPATFGVRLKAQVKPGTDPSGLEKFTVSCVFGYNGNAVTSSGNKVGETIMSSKTRGLDMAGSKVQEWTERNAGGIVTSLFTIDADGKVTNGNWE
jgi:hypothetical protein